MRQKAQNNQSRKDQKKIGMMPVCELSAKDQKKITDYLSRKAILVTCDCCELADVFGVDRDDVVFLMARYFAAPLDGGTFRYFDVNGARKGCE